MRNVLGRYVNRFEKKHRDFRRYAVVVAVLALIVFVGVNWRLHDKGISMTSDYQCGLKEHKHTEECYKKVLICGKKETDGSEGHTHTADCYKEERKLTCDKEEHTHDADCYDEEGNLICDKEEHTHSKDCYTTEKKLICGKEESKPVKAHHHTDDCYKKELICGLKEHTHTASCYSDESADIENKSDWEATIPVLSGNWAEDVVSIAQSQLGYEESTANFKLADDGETRKGYTRYGAWYGNKYGDWSAMFASFCLNYAEIPSKTVPVNSGSTAWITKLKQQKLYKAAANYNPTAGDLVFLDADSDGKADHVGIITKTKTASFTAVVGDSNDAVEENTYKRSSDAIIGYCALPENPKQKTDAESTTVAKASEEKTTEESADQKTSSEQTTTQSEEGTDIFNALTSENDSVGETDAVFFVQKTSSKPRLSARKAKSATNADEGVTTQDAGDTTDFGQYITSASLKKLVGDTWTDANELQDGDNIKVKLEYTIPEANIVTTAKPTITYQLSDGIKLRTMEQGIVSGNINGVYYTNLGDYKIATDGKITITFNETFLATNQKFTGDIEFQGMASNDSTSDNKNITFGATGTYYTVKPKPVNEDLTVKKTASEPKDGKISYTITATSNNGTGTDNVKISDSLYFSGLNKDNVKIENITVKDKNGNVVPSNNYKISYTDDDTHKNFDITQLPSLKKGEQYTITYDVNYGQTVGNGSSSLNNTVTGYKGDDWKSQDYVYTELSKKMIEKSGWATDDNTKIQWTIKINPDRLSGVAGEYTLTDLLKKGETNTKFDLTKAESFTIKKRDSNWQETDVTNTAYKNGKITIEDGCSYEITYKTPVEFGDSSKVSYNNEASIKKDDKEYSSGQDVGVTKPGVLSKIGTGTQEGSNNTAIANWKATLKLLYFSGTNIVYEDTLLNKDGNVDDSIHYATVRQLRNSLKLSCEVSNNNQEQQITDYKLTCYDANGAEVTAEDAKVVKFKIELTKPTNGKNLFVRYSTTMNIKDLAEDAKLTVKNRGEFDGKTSDAANDYTNIKRLYKYGGKKDSNGNISYGSGNTTVDYEAQDGKLYYRIIVKPKDTKSLTITDTLPEGVTLNPDDVDVKIYKDQWNILYETWYDKKYNVKEDTYKPEISVEGRDLKITFKNEDLLKQLVKNTHGFCIDYKVTLSDSFWKDLKNSENKYINTVLWNGKTETQETTVTRQTDVLDKTAEQVVGEDGKVTNKVKYYVTINPAGEKLNEGKNLTLTDTLGTQNVTSEIQLGTVKLYSYNYKNKTGHYKGEELNANSFTFRYDESKKTFTAVVPDQTPCVLEYEYAIQFGDKNSVTLSNSVKLTGQDSTSSNNSISIQASSSSASATKGSVLEIIKVDSQHYQVTLSGAEFRINSYINSQWTQGNQPYTTGDDGSVNVESDKLTKNILYAVEETEAPANYKKTDTQYYFVWLKDKTADNWWNENGSSLKDKDGKAINRSDIYFIANNSGTMMIPNQYSKLEVTKLWRDSDGNPTTNAGTKEIKVKLKKVTQKAAEGYNVTIKYCNKSAWSNVDNYSKSYTVKKGGKIIITAQASNDNTKDYILPSGWKYKYDSGKGLSIIESNEITSDNQTFEVARNWDWNHGEVVTLDSPGYVTISEDVTGVENPITLSASSNPQKNWTYSWDNLPTKDEQGNNLYYTVEEENVPSGYIVSYTGNDGIQSGQISIINKKDKNSYTLPETGGSGTLPFIAGGASLMGFALLCGYSIRRRRGRRVE